MDASDYNPDAFESDPEFEYFLCNYNGDAVVKKTKNFNTARRWALLHCFKGTYYVHVVGGNLNENLLEWERVYKGI